MYGAFWYYICYRWLDGLRDLLLDHHRRFAVRCGRDQPLEGALLPYVDELTGNELALAVRMRALAAPGALAARVATLAALAEAAALPLRGDWLPLHGELQ